MANPNVDAVLAVSGVGSSAKSNAILEQQAAKQSQGSSTKATSASTSSNKAAQTQSPAGVAAAKNVASDKSAKSATVQSELETLNNKLSSLVEREKGGQTQLNEDLSSAVDAMGNGSRQIQFIKRIGVGNAAPVVSSNFEATAKFKITT